MKIQGALLAQIRRDLSMDVPYVRGEDLPVRRCWHFYSDGRGLDAMFLNDREYQDGMNRIFLIFNDLPIVLLAFSLMDTHFHFILYGDFDSCCGAIHEYVRQTSRYIAMNRDERNKLKHVPINHQRITDKRYLKTAICYTLRNAPVGGIPFNAYAYPWSSGPLYFRRTGLWSSPAWTIDGLVQKPSLSARRRYAVFKTRNPAFREALTVGNLVFPGEYVAFEIVEELFKTCKAFHYFMCSTKEETVESRGGQLLSLSIPIQELRQHRDEICREMFGEVRVGGLDAAQRFRLAKVIRSRYLCSPKQIAHLCGLKEDELEPLL